MVIVDMVSVNSVMWAEGWERGKGVKGVKGVKTKGWGSCYQTGNQGGWELFPITLEGGHGR